MSDYARLLEKNPRVHFNVIRDDIKNRMDKDFYLPIGTQVYVGLQGSGKTMSAVHDLRKIKRRWPKCVVVSNLDLNDFKAITLDFFLKNGIRETEYIAFQSMEELSRCLVEVNNGKYGVHYLIDEIHTYFNSLQSANIPMFVFTEISQQRKQRKSITGTSQIFMRLAKPFREQCDNVIFCDTYFGKLTRQEAFHGASIRDMPDGSINPGRRRKLGFFWQSRADRSAYDTFQKVVSAQEQYETAPVYVGDFPTKGGKKRLF